LACSPSSCFDVDNEEADAHENVVVADGHADEHASSVMTNDGEFDDNLGETLNASSMATPSLHLDLAFRVVDFNINLARTTFSLPPPPLPPPLPSPPSTES